MYMLLLIKYNKMLGYFSVVYFVMNEAGELPFTFRELPGHFRKSERTFTESFLPFEEKKDSNEVILL
ncbi:hypothetical protein WN944_011211 [Citrus x changshan-huyou]|uniref:Uncharacterized protein n=1 Tax=Citrus x changshan-huyou TaxID=2935761 RepID=A0AAP0MV61_9ROSI